MSFFFVENKIVGNVFFFFMLRSSLHHQQQQSRPKLISLRSFLLNAVAVAFHPGLREGRPQRGGEGFLLCRPSLPRAGVFFLTSRAGGRQIGRFR